MKIVLGCAFCGKEHSVEVDFDKFMQWKMGALIQNAMPELNATQREQLISGICPDCQERIFGGDE